MTSLCHDDLSRWHDMAVLDHDESSLQARSQSLFYCLSHRRRSLPRPEYDHAIITTQVISTSADDELLAVS